MKVKELMVTDVITIREGESTDAAVEKMEENGIHHLVVLDNEENLVGVISIRDIRLLENLGTPDKGGEIQYEPIVVETVEIGQLMSSPVIVMHPEDPIKDAAKKMLDKDIHCFPVLDQGKLLGIITEKDFLKAVALGKL